MSHLTYKKIVYSACACLYIFRICDHSDWIILGFVLVHVISLICYDTFIARLYWFRCIAFHIDELCVEMEAKHRSQNAPFGVL